jgi:hypothetical protein
MTPKGQKEQTRTYMKAYRMAHLESKRKANRAWVAANPEKARASQKLYLDSHKEQARASKKLYRAANKERLRLALRVYRAEHPKVRVTRALQSADDVRAYMKAYNAIHRERLIAQKKIYYVAHREEDRARHKAYYATHQDSIKAYLDRNKETKAKKSAVHRSENRGYYAAKQRAREAARLKAMPLWANREAMDAIYREAARLTRETGVKHDVDHIYPLKGKTVCGLHVEYNLQILTHVENMRKFNKLMPIERAA